MANEKNTHKANAVELNKVPSTRPKGHDTKGRPTCGGGHTCCRQPKEELTHGN